MSNYNTIRKTLQQQAILEKQRQHALMIQQQKVQTTQCPGCKSEVQTSQLKAMSVSCEDANVSPGAQNRSFADRRLTSSRTFHLFTDRDIIISHFVQMFKELPKTKEAFAAFNVRR